MRLTNLDRVFVVGGGPFGAILTLALARRGVPVTLLEAADEPFEDQRAATVHPSTVEMLVELGLRDYAWDTGLLSPLFHYRDRPADDLVAMFDVRLLEGEVAYPFVLQWEQYKLVRACVELLDAYDHAEVRFSHRVTDLSQTADAVSITVENPGGVERLTGGWVFGTDGGRSLVRKLTGIAFEGFTWPERLIKIGTTFNLLETDKGYCSVGEGDAIAPPAAIANALADAFKDIGAMSSETPCTPRRMAAAVATAS